MADRRSTLVATLLLTPALAAPVQAQAQEWTAEAQAGRFHYFDGRAHAVSSNLGLGIRRDARRSQLVLSAAVPLASGDPFSGYAGVWRRLALGEGAFFGGVDLSGHGFLHRDRQNIDSSSPPRWPLGLLRLLGGDRGESNAPASSSTYGLGGEALAVAGIALPRTRAEARYGVSRTYTAFEGDGDLDRALRVSDVQLAVKPTGGLTVRAQVQRFDAEEDRYNRAGVTAQLEGSPASVWASAGHWFSPGSTGTPWAAGASLNLHDRVSLNVSGRRDTFDPVYLAGPRTSWTIGLAYRFGAAPRPAEPVPASYVDGRATILLPIDEVEDRPLVAGDFNDWQPEPMVRDGKQWSYTVSIAPGAYHYAFVSAEGKWFVPESVPGRKDDGMGGDVAVLIVR